MRDFKPHPYQALMIAFAIRVLRCALWAGMGMGKTSSVLAVIDTLLLAGLANKIVVFAPLRVARDTWPDEVKKWKQFAHLKVGFIEWTVQEREFLRARSQFLKLKQRDEKVKEQATLDAQARARALRSLAAYSRLQIIEKLDVLAVNYDVIPQLLAILQPEDWPFDMVVADESTRLKNLRAKQGGKRTRLLAKIAFDKVKRWINLTGTPSPNGLQDLWGQTWYIDAGHRLGSSFDAFQSRWFGFQRAKDAVNAHKTRINRIAFPHAQKEIQDLLRDVCLAMDPKDWFDLREPIVRTVTVKLPPKARQHYREMAKKMFTEIEGLGVVAVAAAGKTNKCLQLANGFAYTNDEETKWVEVHDEKLEALESIIEEAAGMPVLVAYHYQPDLVRLKRYFPDGLDLSTKEGMAAAKRGEGRVWFGHPQSMGLGVDGLQYHSNIFVFFAHWWDLEPRQQVVERIGPMRQKQAGFDRPFYIYNIVAEDTVDELVIERTESKRSVQEILVDAMKHQEVTQ